MSADEDDDDTGYGVAPPASTDASTVSTPFGDASPAPAALPLPSNVIPISTARRARAQRTNQRAEVIALAVMLALLAFLVGSGER